MKNLVVFTSVMMIGAAAFADVGPRVYKYSANLKTTVAKQEKVSYKDCDGYKQTVVNCYRKAGKLTLKGVFFLDCDCYDWDQEGDYGQGEGVEGTQLLLLNTSFNKKNEFFTIATGYANGYYSFWNGRRFGSSVTTKAKSAELGLNLFFSDTIIYTDTENDAECGPRWYDLCHAGFGKVTTYKCKPCGGASDADPQFDIASISGTVCGWAYAPYCFTSKKTAGCGFCGTSGSESGCGEAMAFYPCEYEFDVCDEVNDAVADEEDYDVVFGTWKLQLDTKLSLKVAKADIEYQDVGALIDFLSKSVFGKNATEIFNLL